MFLMENNILLYFILYYMNYSIDPYGNIIKGFNPNPNGLLGLRGFQGIMGNRGEQGDIGKQGIQGPIGPRGAHGMDGQRGDQGDKGEKGIKGITGDRGKDGINGEMGIQGDRGLQGADGPDLNYDGISNTAIGYRGDPASYANIVSGECYWLMSDTSNTFKHICMPNFAVRGINYNGGLSPVGVKCCHLELLKPKV